MAYHLDMNWKKWGLVFLFVLSACARRVTVDTYTAPLLDDRGFPAGATFQVLENASTPNPIFDRNVKQKIETLLQAKGFKLVGPADAAKADYVADYAYEMTGREETRIYPNEHTGSFYFTGTAGERAVYAPMHFTTYMIETYPVFTSKLRIRVLTPPSRKSEQDRTLWVGEVWNESISRDMRESIDYLAAAGVRMLGLDSQKPKSLPVREDDELLKILRDAEPPVVSLPAETPNPSKTA